MSDRRANHSAGRRQEFNRGTRKRIEALQLIHGINAALVESAKRAARKIPDEEVPEMCEAMFGDRTVPKGHALDAPGAPIEDPPVRMDLGK